MPLFFERLTAGQATGIVILFVLLYGIVTLRMLKRGPKLLWIPAMVILVLSMWFYWYAYDYAAAKHWFPKLILALISSLDLFLFKLASGFGNLVGFFNLKAGVPAEGVTNPQVHLILLQGLYLCAIWTTSILAIHFLAGRLLSRAWLWLHSLRAPKVRTHIFLGTGPLSIALAKSIPSGDRVLFVEGPTQDPVPDKVSIFRLFRGVRSTSITLEKIRSLLPDAILLKANKRIGKSVEESLFEELGLKRLRYWADREDSCFYLLSEDTDENVAALKRMLPVKAQVYYYAKREGLALKTDLASPENLHIVDTSFLATKALKLDESLYPIHLVDIAKDADGEPAGYVDSPFHALVCGFGESGRGALSFLYEFGAFVNGEGNPSPFQCDIVDERMERLSDEFRSSHPALDESRVHFVCEDVRSHAFKVFLRERIGSLNYVFISFGEDGRNIDLAIEILACAYQYRPSLDKFLIVVKMDHASDYQETIQFFNSSYGDRDCIRIIGDVEKTWTWDNISGESYIHYARLFQAAYAASTSSEVLWDDRMDWIRRKPGTGLAHKLEIRRKTEQDFANYFHVREKAALCPRSFWNGHAVPEGIPDKYEGCHFVGDDSRTVSVLDYLARLEHLRWNASHEMAGYRYAEEKKEDLMTHPDMRPYALLDEETRHHDWIVVKTTLNILADGMQDQEETK